MRIKGAAAYIGSIAKLSYRYFTELLFLGKYLGKYFFDEFYGLFLMIYSNYVLFKDY